MATYDCVFWWQGGAEVGAWRVAMLGSQTAEEVADEIIRGGRVALPGRRTIGCPDDPPNAADRQRCEARRRTMGCFPVQQVSA